MKQPAIFTAALLLWLGTGLSACAQLPVAPPSPVVQQLSAAELDQMLAPIALYPDPLLGEILPAATLPSEVVLANRYVNGGGDPGQIDEQPWDASVKALARYPAVLRWLDENLAWTTTLGQAFLYQPQEVMDSVQRLRAQAMALGNLQTTPQQNVYASDGLIEIVPANPTELYVPVYQPDQVFFERPVGAPFISFGLGFTIGTWLDHDFDWRNHHLMEWQRDQPRPPGWWSRPPHERPPVDPHRFTAWQPRNHPGQGAGGFDRGWGGSPPRSTVYTVGGPARPAAAGVRSGALTVYGGQPGPGAGGARSGGITVYSGPSRPVDRNERAGGAQRPAAAPASRAPSASGALIGVRSSQETRQFSNRGQESRQTTATHAAPAPAAPSHTAPTPAAAPSHSAPAEHSGGGGKH